MLFSTKVLISYTILLIVTPNHHLTADTAFSECQSEYDNLLLSLSAFYPFDTCYQQGRGKVGDCTFDYRPVSGVYEKRCVEAGGQIYRTDDTYDCSAAVSSTTIQSFSYFYLNEPQCVGASCSLTEVAELYDTVIYPSYEKLFNNIGFFCNISSTAVSPISEKCLLETNELLNNTKVNIVYPSNGCLGNPATCTFDYIPVSGQFENVCVEAGGLVYKKDISFNCSSGAQDFDYIFLNDPYCLGASCNLTEVEEWFDAFEYPQQEDRLQAIYNFTCDVSGTNATGENTPVNNPMEDPTGAPSNLEANAPVSSLPTATPPVTNLPTTINPTTTPPTTTPPTTTSPATIIPSATTPMANPPAIMTPPTTKPPTTNNPTTNNSTTNNPPIPKEGNTTNPTEKSTVGQSSSISGGAIAGIVVALLVATAAGVFTGLCCKWKSAGTTSQKAAPLDLLRDPPYTSTENSPFPPREADEAVTLFSTTSGTTTSAATSSGTSASTRPVPTANAILPQYKDQSRSFMRDRHAQAAVVETPEAVAVPLVYDVVHAPEARFPQRRHPVDP